MPPRLAACLAALVVLVLAQAAQAPAARAQELSTLFSSIDGVQDVRGINAVAVGPTYLGEFRHAAAFRPTRSGEASLLSIRGTCVIPYPTGNTCQGIGEVSIQADVNGRPSGVPLGTMGFYMADSLGGQPVARECGRLSPRVQLVEGTRYWAVMSAPDEIGWYFWKEASSTSLQSIDGGLWKSTVPQKTLALRIDAGFDQCVPRAVTNPAPGSELADMYVRTGRTARNTITIENTGVAPLTWSGATFSGADASVFTLIDQLTGAVPRYPRQIGVGSLRILEVRCTGGTVERWYEATLTLHTNDPNRPAIAIKVRCMVDNTPPKLSYTADQPDGENGWHVTPIVVNASAVDPEPGSGVAQTTCWSGQQVWQAYGGFQRLEMKTEGIAGLGCSAVDLAGNGTDLYFGEFKLDTRRPEVTPVYSPAPSEHGWNRTPTGVTFGCADATPGSGVAIAATGGGSVEAETDGIRFSSSGCKDVAGWTAEPVTATVRIDMTKPVVTPAPDPAPNAAGWNRTDVTVGWTCEDVGTVRAGIGTDTLQDVFMNLQTSGTTVRSSGDCVDRANNPATAAEHVVKLDRISPTSGVTGGPVGPTTATTATFTVAGSDSLSGLAGLECRLDAGAWTACGGDLTFRDLPDGLHQLMVRGTDVAGNLETLSSVRLWTVDTVAPQTTITGGPQPVTTARSATITYSGDALGGSSVGSFQCRLDGSAWLPCGAPYVGLADGEHRAEVRAVDAAGNVDATPASRTWVVDTAGPETTIDAAPPTASNATSATFAYGGDALGGTTIAGHECRLDGGAWAACKTTYDGLAEGGRLLEVRAYDAAGNRDGTPATAAWTVDTAAPQTWIASGPPATTREGAAGFEYLSDALGGTEVARYQCRLDDGAWAVCADAYSDLDDGDHILRARAVDAAGNADATPAEHRWLIDSTGPQTTISSAPAAVTASRSAAFAFEADALGGLPVALVECRLDTSDWGPCPDGYADLAAGEHTFVVRATDGAGNVDETPASRTWTIDLAPPETTLAATPPPRAYDTTARFALEATDTGGATVAGFECRLDEGDFTSCPAESAWPDLSDGEHTFAARAIDTVGNVEETPVAYTWTVKELRAADDEAQTREDEPVEIDLGVNDLFPGSGAVSVAADARSAQGGSVAAAGKLKVRYSPPAGFAGTDRFAYALRHEGDTVRGTVTVRVTAVDDAPPPPPAPSGDGPGVAPPPPVRPGGGPVVDQPPAMTVRPAARCGRTALLRVKIADADADPAAAELTASTSSPRVQLTLGGTGGDRTVAIRRPRGLRRATVVLRLGAAETRVRLRVGTADADRLRGGAGSDLLFGRGGADRIAGRGGADLLCGGGGRDRLRGGAGDDILRGGAAGDVFTPAAGADRLVDFDAGAGDVRG